MGPEGTGDAHERLVRAQTEQEVLENVEGALRRGEENARDYITERKAVARNLGDRARDDLCHRMGM